MSEDTPHGNRNPCQQCGACCATFRVSFYWAEAPGLPAARIEKLTPWLACLGGTNAAAPHCAALSGSVGGPVSCTVYAERPSPCREVQPGDDKCRRARAHHGLAPLGTLSGVKPPALHQT